MSSLTYLAVIVIVVGSEPWYALLAGAGVGLIPTYFNGGGVTYYLQLVFGTSAVLVALAGTARLPESWSLAIERLAGRRRSSEPSPVAAGAAAGPGPERLVPPCTLEVRKLRVAFGGLVAVDSLDLTATTGQITGLIGPNGAGKTTTFNACSGLHRPTSGQVLLNGKDISRLGPAARARRGLGRTFQQMQLFDSLNVTQNVSLGLESAMAGANPFTQILSRPSQLTQIKDRVGEAIELCGLGPFSDAAVSDLSTGQRRLVELARCLAGPFSLLLLDEPSSGLDRAETEGFAEILIQVVERRQLGILLVEHDVALVMHVCKHIYVLDFGELIFEGTPNEARASSAVRAAYLGNTSAELESVVAEARDT
jgi:ABC-type branched-subunit amino acid transport system ATPase component